MRLTVNGVEIPDAQAGVDVRLVASDGEEMGPIGVRFEYEGTFKIMGREGVNDGSACYIWLPPPPSQTIFEGCILSAVGYGGAAKEFEEGRVPITRTGGA